MSQTRSSSVRRALFGAVLAGTLLVPVACGRGAQTGGGAAGNAVGYVRMRDLITKHPLYAQLSKYDEDIAALQLRSVGGADVATSGAELQKQEAALNKELSAAVARTRNQIKQKQIEYQARENEAIRAALAAAGGNMPQSAGAIAAQIQTTSNEQAQDVARQAQANLGTFRNETIAQDKAAVDALRRSLTERADRTYRAKAEEFREKESAFALSEANADAAARLSLRTKLSNLPLDDASRKDITDQLTALDRKEADGLAAMRNRDQAALATLQTQLRSQTTAQYTKEVSSIHQRTNAKLSDRATQTQSALVKQLGGPVAGASGGSGAAPATMSSDMKAKLLALHKKYQTDFQREADQTIKDFNKTKEDLTRRFAEIHGVDVGAQGDVARQIQSLQKQRDELYDEIMAQIEREVRIVAEKRAVGVVFGNIIAPANGVDLTDDVANDLESLHE
jgi:Outer membrane protein (OmpH-like)